MREMIDSIRRQCLSDDILLQTFNEKLKGKKALVDDTRCIVELRSLHWEKDGIAPITYRSKPKQNETCLVKTSNGDVFPYPFEKLHLIADSQVMLRYECNAHTTAIEKTQILYSHYLLFAKIIGARKQLVNNSIHLSLQEQFEIGIELIQKYYLVYVCATKKMQNLFNFFCEHFLALFFILFCFCFCMAQLKRCDKGAMDIEARPMKVSGSILPPPKLCILDGIGGQKALNCPKDLKWYDDIAMQCFHGDKNATGISFLVLYCSGDKVYAEQAKKLIHYWLEQSPFKLTTAPVTLFEINLFDDKLLVQSAKRIKQNCIIVVLPNGHCVQTSKVEH
ncbi:hypothetical protein RFI_28470 [Reticulomyxa filosa]|uniref:Uncharacterized protein n=1 Tax=Reticulomyxa filosa TaxID=46433 RepID=X6M638_RETFI|nr:hypothetical protein RFI_28470 [Reticulomyxa filosa]|eukprot:ETO08917.1 hypothetical protein RFI_28470 [Reticulomyxa filosa]